MVGRGDTGARAMRSLQLDQVRTFLQVVRSGGVGRAAQALNITQPAVTARIKGLEQTIGARLLERDGNGVRLTRRGERLLRHARRLEELDDAIARDVIDPEGAEGLLRIGVSETIAQTWLPDFVEAVHRQSPRLTIELDVDVTVALRERLLEGGLDLALLLGPISHADIENTALPDVPLEWCAAPAVAGGDAARLFGLPVISFARVTRPYRELREAVRVHVGDDVAFFPSASLSAALRLIERGLCVGAMPVAMVAPGLASGALARFDPGFMPPVLRFVAAYRAEPPSHVVRAAAAMAQDVAINFDDA